MGRSLVYWFERMLEYMGASDKEIPPHNMKRKDLTKSQWLEPISIHRVKFNEGCFQRGAIINATKRFNMACT